MTIALTPELRKAIAEAGDEPVTIVDPETNRLYRIVEIPQGAERIADGETIVRWIYPSVDAVFGRSGWDDPRMNEYDLLELLEGVTDDNTHDEIDTGPSLGAEVW